MDQLEKEENCKGNHCKPTTAEAIVQIDQTTSSQHDDKNALENKQMEETLVIKRTCIDVTNNPEANNASDTLEETNRETMQTVLSQQPHVLVATKVNEETSIDRQGNGASLNPQNTALALKNHSKSSERYTEIAKEADNEVSSENGTPISTDQQAEQRHNLEQKLEQLTKALAQKENMISLYQRENAILEKEKQAFRKEKDVANKDKEATVIKFAMKEKLLLDAKKEKDVVEKQLADARKEIKNITTRFHSVCEEKSRMTYIIDEKCNEVRKYQRECEKIKTDMTHLDSKLKYHMNKLTMELEARTALEKKLEEERNAPNKIEEKAHEQLKMEYEANTILLRHEITHKTEKIENLTKEYKKSMELIQELRGQLSNVIEEKTSIQNEYEILQGEHAVVQSALSDEMLNSAKLRGQLDELQVLRTQNALNDEKIQNLNIKIQALEETIEYNTHDLTESHAKEIELLSINKEISESIVNLQNDLCLLKAKMQGIEAENELLKKERIEYNTKYDELEKRLQKEIAQKTEERQLLTKHLSEKTKLYEVTKLKLDNIMGDFEATNHKHATVVKELQREIQKQKKIIDQIPPNSLNLTNGIADLYEKKEYLISQQLNSKERKSDLHHSRAPPEANELAHIRALSRSSTSIHSVQNNDRQTSESSEAETTIASSSHTLHTSSRTTADAVKGPSKAHLVERILRLQQASARQTEKIDFLENHTLSLVAELQKKSKVVQYYMMRDQAGALTTSKSDQHKSELSKYGNGVMSAIFGGTKADNKSMTLELSLEINKKLQAVLEDTLLKNITLKENLDVLGIEVDNLTRKLRLLETKV